MVAKPRARTYKGITFRSKLERDYAEFLDSRDDVTEWKYEPIKIRLRGKRYYRPDFLVVFTDGTGLYHEVKAPHRWSEKGILKLCYAADMNPDLTFILVTKVKGGWEEEAI